MEVGSALSETWLGECSVACGNQSTDAESCILVNKKKSSSEGRNMSNEWFAKMCVFGNARSTKNRQWYGRPKTRSPFPKARLGSESTDMKRAKRSYGAMGRAGTRGGPSPGLNLEMYINGCKSSNVARAKKRPAPQWLRPANPAGLLLSQDRKAKLPPESFSTVARDCECEYEYDLESTPSAGQRHTSSTAPRSDSLDIESSYKLTFYYPHQENHKQQPPNPQYSQKLQREQKEPKPLTLPLPLPLQHTNGEYGRDAPNPAHEQMKRRYGQRQKSRMLCAKRELATPVT
jgi:hypothetical protein